jgi:hypothetical protein
MVYVYTIVRNGGHSIFAAKVALKNEVLSNIAIRFLHPIFALVVHCNFTSVGLYVLPFKSLSYADTELDWFFRKIWPLDGPKPKAYIIYIWKNEKLTMSRESIAARRR